MELRCPMCKEKVKFTAKKCPHCLTVLDNNDDFIVQQSVSACFSVAVFVFFAIGFIYLYLK